MISRYSLPDYLNPDFMRGYVEGYEAAKVDMERVLHTMTATSDCTGTAEAFKGLPGGPIQFDENGEVI